MSDTSSGEARDLAAAAAVHAAREDIVKALGPLAASPLDERACERMRRALARADSAAVRDAVRRLTAPFSAGEPGPDARPRLRSVPQVAADRPVYLPGRRLRPRQLILGPLHGGAA